MDKTQKDITDVSTKGLEYAMKEPGNGPYKAIDSLKALMRAFGNLCDNYINRVQ